VFGSRPGILFKKGVSISTVKIVDKEVPFLKKVQKQRICFNVDRDLLFGPFNDSKKIASQNGRLSRL
jgi:hypothetical protein